MKKHFLMTLLVVATSSCTDFEKGSNLGNIADEAAEWVLLGNHEYLGEGHRFRMTPADQSSSCYLPGRTGISTQVCGTAATWHVRKKIDQDGDGKVEDDDYVKVIQSLDDYSCLKYQESDIFKPKIVSAPCDDSDPNQWLTVENSILTKASFDGTSHPKPSNIGPMSFFVSPETSIAQKQIWRNFITDGNMQIEDNSDSTGSSRSSIYWGHIPAISSIGIASSRNNLYITGIQIKYRNGTSEVLGYCKLQGADCEVHSEEKSEHANPYLMQVKEYISKIEVKVSQTEETFLDIPRTLSSRLTEIRVYVNDGEQERLVMWKGLGNPSAPWRSLDLSAAGDGPEPSLQNRVIAGLFVSQADTRNRTGFIKGIGATFVETRAYKAHNGEIYAKEGSNAALNPEGVQEGTEVIGMTAGNSRTKGYGIQPPRKETVQDWNALHTQQKYKFSTTYYANRMRGGVNVGLIRLCGEAKLDGIFIRPQSVGNDAPPEGFGQYDCESPALAELAENEYISSIEWVSADGLFPFITGPAIVGLRINTNKTAARLVWESTKSFQNRDWQIAFQKPGYAIVGVHGLANKRENETGFLRYLGLRGVISLGAWYAKLDKIEGLVLNAEDPAPPAPGSAVIADHDSIIQNIDGANINLSSFTEDWLPGANKGTCPDQERLAGISFLYHGVCTNVNQVDFVHPESPRIYQVQAVNQSPNFRENGDWATGFTKYECPNDHYVAGFSKHWWGTSGVLCRASQRALSNQCRTLWFDRHDQRDSERGGDFHPGTRKGQCSDAEYMAGIAQRDGRASAILCCAL